ncbi:Aminotransferase-like [Vigna unguiculata]|uniref:Aminotransferase-like n=1 Tax=Vigna unguiculata TaxID=3917 RepID=A0A4D6KVU7_VIGUN|nr:Aminotransferase-like [Vigna unguiculata]
MAFKGCGKLDTLKELYDELDNGMKAFITESISSNGPVSCLFRLLMVVRKGNPLPTCLCQILLEKYQIKVECLDFFFLVNDICMNIMLEDVLFLTGLPIDGKPIIPAFSRDEDAFSIFESNAKTLSLGELKRIACGQGPQNHKIYVVLLFIINCIIVPSGDGHLCHPTYVQFIKELNDVNGYAWGAALLSFLYHGMKKYRKG